VAVLDQLAWLKIEDFARRAQNIIECLVAQLFGKGKLLQHLLQYISSVILGSRPDLSLEVLLVYFKKDAFPRHNDGEDLAKQANPSVDARVAEHFTSCILSNIGVLQRIIIVVPQHNSPINNNVDILIVVEDYFLLVLLNNHKMRKHVQQLK